MTISPENLVGAGLLIVPLSLVAAFFLFRRNRPVFWFALAAILVGTGYLVTTGAAGDIARSYAPSLVEKVQAVMETPVAPSEPAVTEPSTP